MQPAAISGIHEAYLEAGADIVETNTFSGTWIAQGDYDMKEYVTEINRVSGGWGPSTDAVLVACCQSAPHADDSA